jgi:predicted acetyltransferase
MAEIRSATEEDRDAIAFVEAFAFNDPAPRPEAVSVAGTLCAAESGQVVGTAGTKPFVQWFGGATVPCAGIDGVAVLPEHRGRGVALQLMRELLARRREAGDVISTLYPANVQLYRKLGYEYAGLHTWFFAPTADLSPARGEVEVVDTSNVAAVARLADCFSRFAVAHNGPVQSADTTWWTSHVLAHKGDGVHQRTVAVLGPSGLEGYASYFTKEEAELSGTVASCKHLVAISASAFSTLLGYFRRFENSARYLGWTGPPSTAPVGLASSSNGFSVVAHVSRWMARVLDVPGALEGRGYPAGAEAAFTFSVDDPLFPKNAGPWDVRVSGGQAKVDHAGAGEGEPLPVGLFSALYTGFASPADLVMLGAIARDDARLASLAAVFGGPTPWMPDSF